MTSVDNKEYLEQIKEDSLYYEKAKYNGEIVRQYMRVGIKDYNHLVEQAEYVEELEDKLSKMDEFFQPYVDRHIDWMDLHREIDMLKNVNINYQEALSFYAYKENHVRTQPPFPQSQVELDNGKMARKVLEDEE